MSNKTNKNRGVKISEEVKDFAKIEFDKKFKKRYRDYYDSKKEMKEGYYSGLIDMLPDAIQFVIKSGYIQTDEVQATKGQIYKKICDPEFVKRLKKSIDHGDEIENIQLLPIIISEILLSAEKTNAELLKNDPEAKIYDLSDLVELSELILKKKIKKLKKKGVPKDIAFDVLSVIPCDEALGMSQMFRVRQFYDVLYTHAKEKDIPLKEIISVVVPETMIPKFITFALLERKEKFGKLTDKQKKLYLDISTWCFDTMEKDLKNKVVEAMLLQYIDIRKKDESAGRDSNRRYALSSLAPTEYERISTIVQALIVEDPNNKKYL